MYIDNIYYVSDKTYKSKKLNKLVSLKRELDENKLLIYDGVFKTYIKDKKIYIYGYDYFNNLEEKIVNDLKLLTDVVNIKKEYNSFIPDVYEFNKIQDEVEFVAFKISELLDNGIDIKNIKLCNVSSDYNIYIERIFNLYKIPVVLNNKVSLYSTKIGKYFLDNLNKDINVMIKEFEKIDDDIVREIEIKKLSESTNVSYDLIKSKLKEKEKKVIITHKPKNIKINKYEKASKYILYRMINDNNMILYYFNNLSYLPNDTERKLASEIVLFYKKFNSFNLSDFIIYLEDKKELINLVIDISDLKYTEDELNDNIDNYFDAIKESLYNNQIVKLTSELKNESNSVKKMEIAQKIVDLKMKESNKDE